MNEISMKLGVSLDAVVSFFRKHKIIRRTQSQAQKIHFEKSVPSFTKNKLSSNSLKELAVIGAMLYWGEGYKGTTRLPANIVDFANSDPAMVMIFLKFLRSVYNLDEKKFRIFLYYYSDQDIRTLISFWSKATNIPKAQFTKPYVRNDFNVKSNKMVHGLVHIRYGDKKLLLDIKSMIDYYVQKYAPVV